MTRTFLLLGLLTTSGAWAQSVALDYTFQESDIYRFNASSCSATIQVTWTSTIVLGACGSGLTLWVTEGECQDTPGVNDPRFTTVPITELARKTGTFTVALADLPGFKYSDAGYTCGTPDIEKPHRICGAVGIASATIGATCVQQQAKSLSLIYDTKAPAAPTIGEVSEQDSALQIKFTAQTDTSVVHFDTRAQGEVTFAERAQIATTAGSSIRIQNLINGTTYDIQARAEDSASNFSVPSAMVAATPRLTKGFWANVREAGSAEKGGCQVVDGVPLFVVGGLWLLRRNRKRS